MTIFLKVCDHDLLDKAMGKKHIQHANNLFPSFFGSFPVENGGKIQINKIRFAQTWQINSRVELSHLQVFFSYGASSKNCG